MGATGEVVLKLLVSGVLFASAAAKWSDFEATVLYFSGLLQMNVMVVRIAAAIVVCAEVVIAAAVMFVRNNGIVYWSVLLLLFGFTIVSVLFFFGDVPNCGCMGTRITTTPIVSVYKNIALMIAIRMIGRAHPASINPKR